ncbi:MAG: diaminopimelate epimerase [Marinovum algicola]|uniref:Diaminopimelate epimerase n=1 Tax=Marinovum algicola TaxID=42444 RepID=A0A975ZQY4_9RHOB|nr:MULTISPECIES: diaminopimelate epimerase [Marinovum]MDD9742263.1 diaminopimelate epimerase [Marinovum sp. SP66]SEK09917.1 diaminopimelate epimerase [Marinovum algicola]SLN77028.1 Diaminopimelate epimerase [Marinovum algicola]
MNTMDQTDRTFMKMHGLGNDFVVLDGRARKLAMTPALATALADRHRGVGFDQLAVIVPGAEVDAELIFYNADGSISAACGNATRCIARHLMDETGKTRLRLKAGARVLEARDAGQGLTSVNMGPPETHWQGVPLARAMETLELPIEGGPTATGMGNPHCTFFVADAEAVDLESRGPEIENHPLFPERTNVQFVSVTGENILRMRVWERGTGVTLASGSSSCATAVAAHRRGLTGPEVTIHLDGGEIRIRVTDEGVWMTGPTAHVFTGTLTDAFLESLT